MGCALLFIHKQKISARKTLFVVCPILILWLKYVYILKYQFKSFVPTGLLCTQAQWMSKKQFMQKNKSEGESCTDL